MSDQIVAMGEGTVLFQQLYVKQPLGEEGQNVTFNPNSPDACAVRSKFITVLASGAVVYMTDGQTMSLVQGPDVRVTLDKLEFFGPLMNTEAPPAPK